MLALEAFLMRKGGGGWGVLVLAHHLSSPTLLATALNSVAHVFCPAYSSSSKLCVCVGGGGSEVQEESGTRAQEGGW